MWYYLWKLYEWITSPLNIEEEEEDNKVKVVKLDENGERVKEEPSPLDKSVVETYKSVLCKNINKDKYDKVVEDLDAFNKYRENFPDVNDDLTLQELTKFLEVENDQEPIFKMDDI
jgi:hypothetical protein